MGLFFNNDSSKRDRFNVNDYPDPHKFAARWQYEFADMLGCDADEGYYEAIAYWKTHHLSHCK